MKRLCLFVALTAAVIAGQSLQSRLWPLLVLAVVVCAVFMVLAEGEAR